MSASQAAARGQRRARQTMTDRVAISRPSGGWTTDSNGHQVPARADVHTDVPAWVRALPQQSRIVEVGGDPVTLLAYDVLLPHAVDDVRVDDLVTVTASDGTDLQGKTLTVVDVTFGTHQVARRLVCRIQL